MALHGSLTSFSKVRVLVVEFMQILRTLWLY